LLVAAAVAALSGVPAVLAQTKPAADAPRVEERPSVAEPPLEIRQIRAGIAHRELQQAEFEAKIAEDDVKNTQEALNTTNARANLLKRDLEKATQARDAAKTKLEAARKRYDEALQATSR
jgi:chromosome segregation ATPase